MKAKEASLDREKPIKTSVIVALQMMAIGPLVELAAFHGAKIDH
jgi:hypothetical protein